MFFFFFFQAEDGIRDDLVTGVQTCALPIFDPDSLDVSAVLAGLKKLPTRGMATPVIIEQYTPPKPAVAPSPVAAASPDSMTTATQKPSAQDSSNPLGQTPQLANSSVPAMQSGTQMDAKKEEAGRIPMLPESTKAPDAMTKPGDMQNNPSVPKPTPPPKNPQMVVTELQRAKLLRAV